MDREIKFRAFVLGTNEWIKGNYAKTILGNFESEKHQILPFGENVLSKEINVSTLGQFTGLVDNNGKEVYEGGIITGYESKDNGCINVNNFIVLYDDYAFNAYCIDKEKNEDCWLSFFSGNKSQVPQACCEVIGNIHENKELLNN